MKNLVNIEKLHVKIMFFSQPHMTQNNVYTLSVTVIKMLKTILYLSYSFHNQTKNPFVVSSLHFHLPSKQMSTTHACNHLQNISWNNIYNVIHSDKQPTLDTVFLSYMCMCLNTKKCLMYYEMEGEIDRVSLIPF